MTPERTLTAVNAYLAAQAISPTRPSRRRGADHPRFVTISRQAGAGGTSVGQRVVDLLNAERDDVPWTLFDRSLVDAVLEKHNLPQELSRYMTEAGIRAFQETVQTVLGRHPSSFELVQKTNETILTLGQLGNAVLLGRGANLLTRQLTGGFHVRLVADHDTRLERIKALHRLDDRRAEEHLRRVDKDRAAYVREHFGTDIEDVLTYDCVLNTARMSHDEAARMIAHRFRLG